jgi:iron complex outermembrane receptor protein
MSKTSLYLLLFSVSPLTLAQEQAPEIIEVLAPKQNLAMAQKGQNISYVDDRLINGLDRTIADQLTSISGVSLNGQGGQFQSYSIRGFSRGRIRTEVNGIPIITDRRAGNSISFLASDLFSSASVIKGPGSSLYGSQALGGVVNLSTQTTDESSISIQGQSDSDLVSLTAKHNLDSLGLGLAYQKAGNQHSANGDELNTQFERVSGFVNYQYQYNELTATFSWLPSVGKDIGKSNINYDKSEVSAYPEELHSLAQVQVNSTNGWLVKLFHHYQNWDSETLKFEQYDALTQYRSHTLGGQWLQQFNFAHIDSYIGVDWLSRKGVKIDSEYELFQQQQSLTPDLLISDFSGNQDNLAVFNNNQWQLGNAKFALSFRLDWLEQKSTEHRNVSEQAFSSALSAAIPLLDTLDVTFELANGFRYPTLSERFFNGSTPRGLVVGNDSLKPETSFGKQLGLTWLATDAIQLSSSFYHYDLDNYIERFRVDADTRSYRNLATAEIYGLELEAQWFVGDNLEHKFSYQEQTGKDDDHNVLDDLLPRKLSWNMMWNIKELSVNNTVSHHFKAVDVGSSEAERKAYTLWDLSLSYPFTPTQTVSLVVNNISDENYYGSLDEDASLQPKRSFKLSTTWLF